MNPRLKALAYGMLGSVADAEDVVSDAYLRLHELGQRPDSEEAFLYRVVSNLCIDRLRQAKRQRQAYVGPWLPDPWDDSLSREAELASELTMGMMLLMETLSPAERIVYVLREAFDYSYDDISAVLNVSAQNARQRAHRARTKLRHQAPLQSAPAEEEKLILQQMVGYIAAGNVDRLVEMMTDDVIAYTDGGGVVSAAIAPVHGPNRIAQVTLHLFNRVQAEGDVDLSLQAVNGTWALVVRQNGSLHSCSMIEVDADNPGKIRRIYVVRHPDKLAALT